MKKRIIAVLALASLTCWSMPVAMALAMQLDVQGVHHGAQPASQGQDHSCCPDEHFRLVPPIFVMPTSAPMPCQDEPCCARQAPVSSPLLPGTTRLSRPGAGRFPTRAADVKQDVGIRRVPENLDTGPFQLSSIRSIVLRN